MNIVIVGFKGAGKSTLGPRLARNLEFSFSDLDHRLAEASSQELGQKTDVRGAFRLLGERRFRELEQSLLKEAMKENKLLLSLGGGAALDPASSEWLRGHCVIYVQVPGNDLVRRIASREWPAYLDGEADPEAALRRRLDERLPRYRELADLIVENPDGVSPADAVKAVAGRVLEWIDAHR
jgi:shikimate kinase